MIITQLNDYKIITFIIICIHLETEDKLRYNHTQRQSQFEFNKHTKIQ